MTRVVLALLSLLSNLLALALPLALIQVYDRILPNQALGTAAVLFSAVAVAIGLDGMTRYARASIFARMGGVAEHDLSVEVARQTLAMRRDELRTFGAGHIEELFASVSRSRDILVGESLHVLFDAPFAVIFLVLVWFLGGPIVLAPVAILLAIGAIACAAALAHRRAGTDRFAARAARKSLTTAGWARAELFRTQGLAGGLMARLKRTEIAAAAADERAERAAGTLMDLTQVASLASYVGILWLGAAAVLDGAMTAGAVAACLILGQRAVAGLIGVASTFARRQVAVAAHRELRRALAADRAPVDATPGKGAGPLGVSLALADGRQVEISPGALTIVEFDDFDAADAAFAQIGDALVDLLEGRQGAGAIALKGAAPDIGPEALAANVALVGPMPRLLRGPVMDNLTGFDPRRTDRAIAVAERLGLDAMLGRLAHGYQTRVGETLGAPLSHGAVKRAGLVGGFASTPGLLVLNNPAYGLDKDGVDRLLAFLPEVAPTTTVLILTREGTFGGDAGETVSPPRTDAGRELAA